MAVPTERDVAVRVVRFFPEVRSTHLERSGAMASATTLYLRRRDDLDPGLERVHPEFRRTSALGLVVEAVRLGPDVLEVSEPLWLPFAPLSYVLALACRTANRLQGRDLRVVSYAIDNSGLDRVPRLFAGRARPLWPLLARTIARMGARQIDWLAFGTEGARGAYLETVGAAWVGGRRRTTVTVDALPAACVCVQTHRAEPGRVLFLGQLHPRKGFDVVLSAWRLMRSRGVDGKLVVLGAGPLHADAVDAARLDSSIQVGGPALRLAVHDELNRASVVVLPSQPGGRWREQVGLPVVEAMAHACHVVTTTETGLADALAVRGHTVLPAPTTPDVLADAIRGALARHGQGDDVLAGLPPVDGRILAERWLVGR